MNNDRTGSPRVIKVAHRDQTTAAITPDAIPKPGMLNQLFGDRHIAAIFITGKFPHQRDHRGIDLEWHGLDRAYGLSMRPNRTVFECGFNGVLRLGVIGLDERGRDIAGAFHAPRRPPRRRLKPRFV